MAKATEAPFTDTSLSYILHDSFEYWLSWSLHMVSLNPNCGAPKSLDDCRVYENEKVVESDVEMILTHGDENLVKNK